MTLASLRRAPGSRHAHQALSVACAFPTSQRMSTCEQPGRHSRAMCARREYHNIFKHGNRNAASHLWSSFLLDRAYTMTTERLVRLFHGFCAVSGSPVNPHDYSRYLLTLDNVEGTKNTGYMVYCCWPCVCDTQVVPEDRSSILSIR